MTKKIGRNDPCPCGSGKKYKHCCMLTEGSKDFSAEAEYDPLQFSSLNAPKIIEYLEAHDVTPIIDYIIALQLNPANNGKNLRLEHLCQLAISSLGKSKKSPDLKVFKQLIDEEYPYDMMEDVPLNMYCETVVFHGGNYVFFPGLSTHCSELFRAMTESIYRVDGVFSDTFKSEIYKGVALLLELGNGYALRAGLKRMTRGNDNPREEFSEPQKIQSYAVPEELMDYLVNKYDTDKTILKYFLLDEHDSEILTSNPEKNPILYQPLVKIGKNYYFLGITNQGCAINNFILRTAVNNNCIKDLVMMTHNTIWNRIGMSCIDYLHWDPFKFEEFETTSERYNECLFRIDVNWAAYVCYAKDSVEDISIDGSEHSAHLDIEEHLKQSLRVIKSKENTKGFHILTLVLFASMGEYYLLNIGEQPDSDYVVSFSAFDFLQLVQTEKWDNMSLVRYARTKENTPSLLMGMNQPLDCYSLYKKNGETFYLSDKEQPNLLQLEPNEGCELIHQSKEKLDFHGTPIHIDNKRIVYIPVQRDIDYASVYCPLYKSLNAKSCESYSIPIWVRCSQTEGEGENPSSITDTVITAIAYWMDKLRPAIEEKIDDKYKGPIEIDLQFDEQTLSDKNIHNEEMAPVREGLMTVSKKVTGVNVSFDNDFIRGFLGADNAQERLMMKGIVSVLLCEKEESIQDILDEFMPLGPAKMILMMEASNSPLSYPLWLNPPIYIHSASIQLLLDLFPLWMKEEGVDIKGKLQNKDKKVEFLHNGVDVLYDKLFENVARFDSHTLLKRLISNHETLLYQREHNKMIHPAQIICFGDNVEKRKEILDTEQRLSNAGIATRALIEYVIAVQDKEGKEQAGSDDIEQLLAIMGEIINIGGICDAIHLEVSDYTIKKLASGRYGIYDDEFNDCMKSFASARTIESVNNQVDDFEDKMEHFAGLQPKQGGKRNSRIDEIDKAFMSDWGVTYSAILQVLYCCYVLAMKKRQSIVELPEDDFYESIIDLCTELNKDNIAKALEHISLEKRPAYLTPPDGFEGKDIYPWIYNRELSFLRRPIMKFQMEDGSTKVVYGFRSCLLAGLQLTDLLYSGRLRHVGKGIGKLLGKFEDEKGSSFNEEVRGWLISNTSLKVWPYDVTIKPKGALKASDDLGDIDVLAYDDINHVLYSIECKNTNTAKNVREMKKEMDDYLGRGDNPETDKKKALVLKHLRRHHWLKDNSEQLKTFIGTESEICIKSMMLTSEVIPTSYLRKEDTPLSILNFQGLKKGGIAYLNNVKDMSSVSCT